MNEFSFVADIVFLFAVANLAARIWFSRSCNGVSGKTQILYALVWTTRNLDVFVQFSSVYETGLKILYASTALATLILIYWKFRGTHNREQDSFRVEFLIVPCFLLALVLHRHFTVLDIFWTFSVYLEAVAVLPQLVMMSKMGPPGPPVRDYLLALILHRTLCVADWINRYFSENYFDPIMSVSGCVQATLLCSFVFSVYGEPISAKSPILEKNEEQGPCSGYYVQKMMECLADIIYAAGDNAVHALTELQNEIRRRGVEVKNDTLKQNGYKNFKMFVEDQPWLVLFSERGCWFVRRRLSHENRPPRALVDANRRMKNEPKQVIVEEEEHFDDPYEI